MISIMALSLRGGWGAGSGRGEHGVSWCTARHMPRGRQAHASATTCLRARLPYARRWQSTRGTKRSCGRSTSERAAGRCCCCRSQHRGCSGGDDRQRGAWQQREHGQQLNVSAGLAEPPRGRAAEGPVARPGLARAATRPCRGQQQPEPGAKQPFQPTCRRCSPWRRRRQRARLCGRGAFIPG